MNSILATCILPDISVEFNSNHDQFIFTNFGDKLEQIFIEFNLQAAHAAVHMLMESL